MRQSIKIFLAVAVVGTVLFGARRVYTSCEPPEEEQLSLQIDSVTRGGEPVDDLSPWKTSDGREIRTVLHGDTGPYPAILEMETEDSRVLEIRFERDQSNQGGDQ